MGGECRDWRNWWSMNGFPITGIHEVPFRDGKTFMTRLGPVTIERTYRYCRDCKSGHYPLDRVPGLEGESHTPGAASPMADVVGDAGYGLASRKLANLAGVTIRPSTLHRWALKIGAQVQRF